MFQQFYNFFPLFDYLDNSFSAAKHKDVLSKLKSQDEIFNEFLDALGAGFDESASASKKLFIEYYTDFGVSIPSDQYFAEVVQNTWNVVEDKESTISVNEIKDIIKTLRYKLIQQSKG